MTGTSSVGVPVRDALVEAAHDDPLTGDPLAISELKPGRRVAIVCAPARNIPLGAGVFDAAVYPEVEAAMGIEIARYVFQKGAVE